MIGVSAADFEAASELGVSFLGHARDESKRLQLHGAGAEDRAIVASISELLPVLDTLELAQPHCCLYIAQYGVYRALHRSTRGPRTKREVFQQVNEFVSSSEPAPDRRGRIGSLGWPADLYPRRMAWPPGRSVS